MTEDLVQTWKESVICLLDAGEWRVIWDGETYSPGSITSAAKFPLYVITAYNPGSEPASDLENRLKDEELREAIGSIGGIQSFVSVGSSLSGSHCEFGYAVAGVTALQVDELARRFGQIGYYRFTESSMEIFAVDEDGKFVIV